jgi:hypothetical protein
MKLSDGTTVCTTKKFLSGKIRVILDKNNQPVGAYFLFNTHKLYYDTPEEAETIRKEIEDNVPDAECPSKETEAKFEEPPAEAEM